MSRPITRLRIGTTSIPSPFAINLTAGGGRCRKRSCLQATARQRPFLMCALDGNNPGYESVQRLTLAWGSNRQNSARPLPAASQPAPIRRARAGSACTRGSSGQYPKRSCSMQRRSSAHVDHGPSAERKVVAMRGDVRRCAATHRLLRMRDFLDPGDRFAVAPPPDIASLPSATPATKGKTIVASPTVPQSMP